MCLAEKTLFSISPNTPSRLFQLPPIIVTSSYFEQEWPPVYSVVDKKMTLPYSEYHSMTETNIGPTGVRYMEVPMYAGVLSLNK